MGKLFSFFIVCLGYGYDAFSQATGPINTDRPDQSDGTYTLPAGGLQLETGLTLGEEENSYLLHNTMLRFGVLPETEVRLSVDYGRMSSTTGIQPVGISVKRRLVLQKGALPDITAVGNIGLPFLSTANFRPGKAPASLLLAFQNDLSDRFSLGYNFGWLRDGETSRDNWVLTSSVGYAPVEKLSFFVEYFSQFAGGVRPDHHIDAGIAWLPKGHIQLDLAAGSAIFGPARSRFATAGFSYLF